jgi:hypothetical protein
VVGGTVVLKVDLIAVVVVVVVVAAMIEVSTLFMFVLGRC